MMTFYLLEKHPNNRTKTDIKLMAKCTDSIKFFKDICQQENGNLKHELCCKFMNYKFGL